MQEHHTQLLANGCIRVDHRPSGLVYTYGSWAEIAADAEAYGSGYQAAAREAGRLAIRVWAR